MKINPKAVLAAAVLLLAGTLTVPGLAMDQSDAPETVTIDTLSNLYQPVEFSHKRHAQRSEERRGGEQFRYRWWADQ